MPVQWYTCFTVPSYGQLATSKYTVNYTDIIPEKQKLNYEDQQKMERRSKHIDVQNNPQGLRQPLAENALV